MKRLKYKVIPMTEKEKTKKLLRGDCWHEIVERGDYGGAECKHCGNPIKSGNWEFEWYCPDSPDHLCHYFSHEDDEGKRYVMSMNGEKILLLNYKLDAQDYHNGVRESSDYCIFCGDPQERK